MKAPVHKPNMTPEEKSRTTIDALLEQAGWSVQDNDSLNLYARRGVAVREFDLKPGHGTADYLLYVDQKAVGVVEAKPEGYTLTGVETQSGKYSDGLPEILPAHQKPLPFLFESTGIETRFTNLLDPEPRSRNVFSFHTPDALAEWIGIQSETSAVGVAERADAYPAFPNLRQRLTHMPPLDAGALWPVQERAILNLEESLALAKPRALIQMATGSGKTFTACNLVYRLIKYAGAKRVLFLVDRNNLGRQTLREFQGFTTPEETRKFTELYNVQLLQSGHIDPVSRVSISTIQRVYSMLRGEDLDPEKDELSGFDFAQVNAQPGAVEYNPDIPIDTFDFIITDECHRSIYNQWQPVLEYFDAFLIGLTATPSAQTFGFFQQNLVMEYTHEEAVADKVNVDSDIYRIRTQITEDGSSVKAGQHIDRRNRKAKTTRWAEELDEDLTYAASQLDRDVVAEDQIRTVIRTFRDRLFTEIFPGRTEVPKTIIFAKDDSHADDIVDIVRTEFGKGNDFCQKITYRTTGVSPESLIATFRNSYHPRIVVTVDMIATGTDIKPVEIVFFMRNVQSRNFFEQMKGRGVRVISPTEFNAVTPDALNKDRFVIIDAVGVTESELSDSYSLEREPTKTFGQLLDLIAKGSREPDHLSSLASRLARLSHKISPTERESIETVAGGVPLQSLITDLVRATNPDAAIEAAREVTGLDDPPLEAIADAEKQLREDAALPFASNPELRQRLEIIHQSHEQTIDTVSKDVVLEAGFTEDAAQDEIQSFQQFIEENRDEITALQVLYERPYRQRLRLGDIRALADAMQAPPRSWTTERLWQAYQRLDESRVRGSGQRQLADIVALVRYATGDADELTPFSDHVNRRFAGWLAMQETAGREFTDEQRWWLEAIRDRIAGNVSAEMRDLQNSPLDQRGGLIAAYDLFGEDLESIIDELNLELVR